MTSSAMCAHLRIGHYTLTNNEGLSSSGWQCLDCGRQFQPVPVIEPESKELCSFKFTDNLVLIFNENNLPENIIKELAKHGI